MPNRGSGKVLSFTSAATTVVGTVAACHPLGTNRALEMTSPLASTLADVCRDHPSRSASLVSMARFIGAACWATTVETRKNWLRLRMMSVISNRLLTFMLLLLTAMHADGSVEDCLRKAPENG